MTEPRPDPSNLFARAAEAWGQGRHEAAAELLEALVDSAPGHVAALNTLGMIALNRGDGRRAAAWIERAAAAEPGSAPLWFNLFQAYDGAGEPERGLAALDRALTVDPDYLPAILMKADVLERLGRSSESLALYRAIIASGPSTDGLPEPALRAFERGRGRVRADDDRRAAALEAPLAELEAAWPGADFARARAYAEQRTGRRKVYVQQPVGGHFPYLPALEFFPREHFPWLAELEARTDEIRSELLAVLDGGGAGFEPYVAFDPTLPANQWAELNHSRRWSAWFFWKDGERQDANCALCPATTALIESLPLLDLPGKGPTAMFSILEPRTRIPPHTGSSNVRTTIHLPLVVPPGCGFRVGSESRRFEAGKAWAFDDTIEHEAWNESGEPRAILILDAWNPLLTDAERAAVRIIG
ncbi:MAG TPA: aspartyl/asparaginyl beta-hydroxylase domain-containing protein [Allosphingosinicella sp.]|nr:aspartyl/asparaginyl beta-hydroxylase domain-containing protein [Allosphingosinicella sp.]